MNKRLLRKARTLMAPRLCSLVAIGFASLFACATASLLVHADSRDLTINASFAGKQSITPVEPFDLTLSRPLQRSEGKLAVFIGQTDMTALFTTNANSLSYAPKTLPLAVGETQLTIYLISPNDQWKEIARFPLRVSTGRPGDAAQANTQQSGAQTTPQQQNGGAAKRFGFDKLGVTPSLTISMKGQLAEAHFPDSNRPERATYADFTIQGSLRTDMTRGLFNSQTQFDVVGVSYQKESLRFGQLADAAPQIDLSSYLMQFQAGKMKAMVGSVSFGSNRHLVNSFSSRGITLTFPINSRSDFSIGAANGTSVVGWGNFVGLNRRKHQIVSGTAGYEFIRERPGGLRLETGLLYGSLQPISNFNQGNIADAERSRGLGLRLAGSDKAGRMRLDAGFTRSSFNNAEDPQLNQGFSVVPTRERASNARYLDASYDILKGLSLTDTRKANLTLSFRHETIDPLFRSVAAFLQADRLQNQLEIVGSVADVMATVSYNRSNDNLDDIPSILKTLSRRSGVILGAPLVSLLGDPAKPAWWFPRLSYSYDRMHQFGTFLPINSGFTSDSQVPDQLSNNQSFASEWQAKNWRAGYRVNHSFQDNRQAGRERADFVNLANNFTFGLTPVNAIDLNFDLSTENAETLEQDRTDRTNRAGTNINWRMTKNSTLAAMVSAIFARDLANTSRNRSAEFDLQWSYRFAFEESRFKKVQAQFFTRYANRYSRTLSNLFGVNNLTKLQTFNVGLSFTFF